MATREEAVKQFLETHLVFSQLDDTERRTIGDMIEVKRYEAGAVIAKAGTPVAGMYSIYSGTIHYKTTNYEGKRVSVERFGPGDVICEVALLKDDVHAHDVVAVDACILLLLPSKKMQEFTNSYPQFRSRLKQRIALAELHKRLEGILGSADYDALTLERIIGKIGIKKIKRGSPIFKQGDEDPRLYLIESGSVELVQENLEGRVSLEKVGAQGLVGESAALTQQPHSYTAMAVTDVALLVIPQEVVQKILELNYELKVRLEQRMDELRSAEESQAVTAKRSEGVDQRIRYEALTEAEFKERVKKKEIHRFPLIRQTVEAQSAAACIAMICKHNGKNFTVGQIAELANISSETATVSQTCTAMEKMGYRAKAYQADFDQLINLPMPCIVLWEEYHYAVLYRVTKNKAYIADPFHGLRTMDRMEFEEGWSNVVITAEPTQDFNKLEEPANPYLHFVSYLLPHKALFFQAFLAAMIINALGLATPIFIQNIVDKVVVHNDKSLLNMMLMGMAMVTIFRMLTSGAQQLLLAHTIARIDLKLVAEFYRHILSLPMTFFNNRRIGDIITRFGENQKIRAIIAGSTITVVLNTIMIFVYLGMMWLYSGILTFLVLIFIPCYILNTVFFTPRLKKIANDIFFSNARQQSLLIESLHGIETVKATANEYFARARWEDAFVDRVNQAYTSSKLSLVYNSIGELINLSSTIAILWYGATEVMAGNLTIGELMGFNMLMGAVMGPIMAMVRLWDQFQEVRIAVERVSDVNNVVPERPPIRSAENLPAVLTPMQGKVEFRDVCFRYGGEDTPLVLNGFNLTVEAGQSVAFVGPSGCGKSTVIRLLMGFLVPTSGEILIDGKELNNIDLAIYRRQIGVVLQDSFLFSSTVAGNIALGDSEPDMNRVRQAARLSSADEFIGNLPQGYNTMVGEKGVQLSGGQRQRVCIARALYPQPAILIFDEATSALDNESEEKIQQNMKSILAGKTSFAVAHRLSTIREADYICFIEGGRIVEKGTHDALVAQKGRYYDLAKKQFDLE